MADANQWDCNQYYNKIIAWNHIWSKIILVVKMCYVLQWPVVYMLPVSDNITWNKMLDWLFV